jgi:hypothetical protein
MIDRGAGRACPPAQQDAPSKSKLAVRFVVTLLFTIRGTRRE